MLCEVINKISISLYDKPFPYFHIAHCISFGNVAVGTSFSSLVLDSQVSFRFVLSANRQKKIALTQEGHMTLVLFLCIVGTLDKSRIGELAYWAFSRAKWDHDKHARRKIVFIVLCCSVGAISSTTNPYCRTEPQFECKADCSYSKSCRGI